MWIILPPIIALKPFSPKKTTISPFPKTEFAKEMEKIRTAPEYQYAKKLLKERADIIKKEYPSDKPLQRMVINNF